MASKTLSIDELAGLPWIKVEQRQVKSDQHPWFPMVEFQFAKQNYEDLLAKDARNWPSAG